MWVFNGARSQFPAGVFSTKEAAEAWISLHCLTGVLTRYPIDCGVYEWAITSGYFSPCQPHHKSGEFIQKFTSASLEHYHYEDGTNDTET